MTATPCVSVIIPTYNRATLLPRAIESVLHQTYENTEIIVVDDGSTDATREILAPYHGHLQYFLSPHRGVAHARNLGMKMAAGKYIAFLDSDDSYLPNKLELQVALIERHPAVAMVCTEFSGQFPDGTFVEHLMRQYHPIWNKKGWQYHKVFSESGSFDGAGATEPLPFYIGNIFEYIIQDTLIPTNTMLLRKNLLEVIGYQNVAYRFAQEYEFAVRICKHFPIAFLDFPTYVLFFHDQQATALLMGNRILGNHEILLDIQSEEVFLKTVTDWAWKDKQFYQHNRRVVDRRLGEIHYTLGKRWFSYGDFSRAGVHFADSVGFRRFFAKAWLYLLLLRMPEAVVRIIEHILKLRAR